MRNIIYLIVLGGCLLFSACQDITVGYLEADTAKYTIDTLHIIANAKSELQRLEDIEANFYSNTKTLQNEIAELEENIRTLYQEYDEEWMMMDDANWEKVEAGEMTEDEYYAAIETINEELDAKYDPLIDEINEQIEEKNSYLENLAVEMGIESLEILKKQITDYQQKIEFKLPWASSPIEGVLGTQPLLFTITGVKSDNSDAAAKFMNYIGVLGDGTIYVELDVDVIPGNYTVSLQIENEGRTKILNDVFTFIVDTSVQETPVLNN